MRRLLSLTLLLASSCGHKGPVVTAEVINVSENGADTSNGKVKGFIAFSAMDKHVCFSPSDLQLILNYCAAKK